MLLRMALVRSDGGPRALEPTGSLDGARYLREARSVHRLVRAVGWHHLGGHQHVDLRVQHQQQGLGAPCWGGAGEAHGALPSCAGPAGPAAAFLAS